jgi:hypothetical protein
MLPLSEEASFSVMAIIVTSSLESVPDWTGCLCTAKVFAVCQFEYNPGTGCILWVFVLGVWRTNNLPRQQWRQLTSYGRLSKIVLMGPSHLSQNTCRQAYDWPTLCKLCCGHDNGGTIFEPRSFLGRVMRQKMQCRKYINLWNEH